MIQEVVDLKQSLTDVKKSLNEARTMNEDLAR
jgi:hypothetical protein